MAQPGPRPHLCCERLCSQPLSHGRRPPSRPVRSRRLCSPGWAASGGGPAQGPHPPSRAQRAGTAAAATPASADHPSRAVRLRHTRWPGKAVVWPAQATACAWGVTRMPVEQPASGHGAGDPARERTCPAPDAALVHVAAEARAARRCGAVRRRRRTRLDRLRRSFTGDAAQPFTIAAQSFTIAAQQGRPLRSGCSGRPGQRAWQPGEGGGGGPGPARPGPSPLPRRAQTRMSSGPSVRERHSMLEPHSMQGQHSTHAEQSKQEQRVTQEQHAIQDQHSIQPHYSTPASSRRAGPAREELAAA